MTRNKKILIGVGVVAVLGGVAYANFRFKRVEGVTVNTEAIQKRDLKAIVSASGKIQPKRFVNISADTSGRVTELAVKEGDRVKQGQFLLQIDPRNLRTRVQSGEASLGAARSQLEQMRLSLESSRTALKQAEDAYRRQQNLAKGGLTTKETLERAENDLAMRKADLASQEQNLRTLQLRTEQEQATLENARTDLSKVRIESPIDGIITRRNVEQGETAVVGTMNNAGTVLLQVADMSVIEAEVEVDETDIPNVQLGQTGHDHGRRDQRQDLHREGDRDRQQPDSDDRSGVDPGHELQGDAAGRGRDSGRPARLHLHRRHHDGHPRQALAVPIQATTVREVVLDDKGADRARSRRHQGRRPSSTTVQASELKPGQERKELEGVFVVRDGKAVFEPVKTGIAGEKYFEMPERPQGRRQRHRRSVRVGADPRRRRGGQGRTGAARDRRPSAMSYFLESATIALQAIWASKLRSFLTVLGNIVAVTSIIAVVSLVQGMNAYVVGHHRVGRRRRQLHHLSGCRWCGRKPTRSGCATTRESRSSDAAAVRRYSENVGAVAAQSQSNAEPQLRQRDGRRRAGPRRHPRLHLLLHLRRRARTADQPG